MSIARFEKVSKEQFQSDLKELLDIEDNYYEDVTLPKRQTIESAGYDFYSPIDVLIKPNEMVRIPTGIRTYISKGYFLAMYPRSSMGIKYQMCLANTTGIIDADYYGAKNEGHIIVPIVNRGKEDMEIHKGDRFVQGIFQKYYLAEEEEVTTIRQGGFGSSN